MVGAAQRAAQKNGALKLGGRPPAGLDMVLDALFFRLRNAGPWRDLPDGFGPWRTIYGWYQRLARQGIWERLLRRLAAGAKSRIRLVDGTHVVVHQCAANPAGGAQKQAMGRTRGGRNTKIMALTDGRGLPVKLSLIEGQAYEGKYVIPLLEAPEGLLVVGDKGFDSDPLRQQLERLGASHCIPSKSNRRKKRRLNKKLYRQRYKVENYFCRLKRWASASTRRDKLASHFLALIQFASVIDWLRYGC
jgi:transposase